MRRCAKPRFFGSVNDYTELAEAVHARSALLLSLSLKQCRWVF